MGSGWDPSTSSIRLLRVQPQLLHPSRRALVDQERPSNLPLCSLIVPLQIKDTVTMDAGEPTRRLKSFESSARLCARS